MMEAWGWRCACFVYAAAHLLVALPLQLRVVPAQAAGVASAGDSNSDAALPLRVRHETAVLVLIGSVLTAIAGIGSIVIVHLLIFLQARGLSAAEAITIGMLFGPAQVGARIVERVFGERYHPIWTLAAAGLLMAAGLLLLVTKASLLALAVCIYAAGYGVSWIARGTVPLAIFGAQRFPVLVGRLAFVSLIGQALAPGLGAWWIEQQGIEATLVGLSAASTLNLFLIAVLWRLCPPR